MSGAITTAASAWGDEIPDWVSMLAQECQATSANRVAIKMNRSASLISQVLRRKYPGNLKAVEETVRGCFMAATITCPELGEIPSNECQDWRTKSRNFGSANALRVRMFRACNRCPRNAKDL